MNVNGIEKGFIENENGKFHKKQICIMYLLEWHKLFLNLYFISQLFGLIFNIRMYFHMLFWSFPHEYSYLLNYVCFSQLSAVFGKSSQ